MKDKKRKSFYNNKHRNEKWTEQPQGRKIDFADKYAFTDGYSDKYDETTRVAHQTNIRKKQKLNRDVKRALAFVLAVLLIGIGYTGMDAHIIRYSKPAKALLKVEQSGYGTMSQLDVMLNSVGIEPISLDNSTMLDSVIEDAREIGFSSVSFDAKRVDGTIGYKSLLATVDTYGAPSSYGIEPKKSIKKLLANDILPVARICCYKDNVVPYQAPKLSVLVNGKVYKDKQGNAYLNPARQENYDYIKDIVTELYDYGVTVFVLTGCDVPKESGKSDLGGFDKLAKRLSNDLQGEAKFLQEVDATITGYDKESGNINDKGIKNQLTSLKKLKNNQVYYISTKIDDKKMYKMLGNSNISSYIIA